MKNIIEKLGLKEKIYQAMDSFLVESEDTKGKQIIRSVEQLNKDRHLFVKRMEKIIQEIEQRKVEEIKKEISKFIAGDEELKISKEIDIGLLTITERQNQLCNNILNLESLQTK